MNARIVIAAALAALAPLSSARAAVDPYEITPEEHAACDADAVRLCASAFPDGAKVLACMRASRRQLTPVCLSAFEAGLRRRNLRM